VTIDDARAGVREGPTRPLCGETGVRLVLDRPLVRPGSGDVGVVVAAVRHGGGRRGVKVKLAGEQGERRGIEEGEEGAGGEGPAWSGAAMLFHVIQRP